MELLAGGLLFGFSIFVGFLIGCIGIGGVLLVPFLTFGMGFGVHASIAAAMFGFIFVGMVGAVLYARHGSIEWSQALWMIAGAMPAAYFGSFLASVIPEHGLQLIIATLVLLAGLNALRRDSTDVADRQISSRWVLLAVGAFTGAGSALTGTGGPLMALPVLVSMKVAAHSAIGFAQAMQTPLATLATIGNFLYGSVPVAVGATISAGLVIGGFVGAKLAHTIEPRIMRRLIAWVLVAVGLFLVGKLLARLI